MGFKSTTLNSLDKCSATELLRQLSWLGGITRTKTKGKAYVLIDECELTFGSCVSLFPARSRLTSFLIGGVSSGRMVRSEEWRERVCRWKQ